MERYYSDKKLRQLSKTEVVRLRNLETALYQITGGVNVSRKQLKSLLTDDEFDFYLQSIDSNEELKQFLKEGADDFYQYNALLKEAVFAYVRIDYYSRRGKRRGTQKMHAKSDRLFERAYEVLDEILQKKPELNALLDRTFSLSPDSSPSLTPDEAPRIMSSKSVYKLSSTKQFVESNNSIKTAVITTALYNLKYDLTKENETYEANTHEQLKKFLTESNTESD